MGKITVGDRGKLVILKGLSLSLSFKFLRERERESVCMCVERERERGGREDDYEKNRFCSSKLSLISVAVAHL
jgi:hypothetical protein